MKRLIVNADDFGINETVTKEIEESIMSGCISSTTVMANGTCLAEVSNFVKEYPKVSFGAHICLSEFDSITQSPTFKKYGLTDEDGKFIRMAIFKVKEFTAELNEAIKKEILAQIRVLRSYGIPLSHCDSHHHVHTIYGLHKVFGEAVKEAGFNKVRMQRGLSNYSLFRHPVFSQKKLWVRRYFKTNFITTDEFCSYSEYLSNPEGYSGEIIELMCHPGHPKYLDEYKMVEEKRAISQDKQLISYLDI